MTTESSNKKRGAENTGCAVCAEREDDKKPRLTPLDNVDDMTVARLKKCVFFVEATRDQRAALYNKFSDCADRRSQNAWDRECQLKFDWVASGTSTFVHAGYIKGNPELPVTLNITIESIGGKDVCFYYPSGNFADYKLIEEWLDLNFVTRSKDGDPNCTNAENFHFVTTFLKHGSIRGAIN